jgi:hypothetical protein
MRPTRWKQATIGCRRIGGGRMEIVSEKKERIQRMMKIERMIMSEDMLWRLPNNEWKALSLLVAVLDGSRTCEVIREGVISAEFDGEVEIQLDVVKTVMPDIYASPQSRDPHLYCYAISSSSGEKVRERACIAIGDSSAGVVPKMDACVTFVLMADSGFQFMPLTLQTAIKFARDPEAKENERRESQRRQQLARETRLRREEEIEARELLAKAKQDQEIRVGMMSWREIIAEHSAPSDEDVESLLADGIRSSELSYWQDN